jgi:hypothetical protein
VIRPNHAEGTVQWTRDGVTTNGDWSADW